MNTFRQRIRQSIENETLQIALDNNAERRLKGRALAFESIPDWRERRQRAHAIREDVIEHLDEYLAQFIAMNEENGVIVHHAEDAAEAIQIILNVGAGLVSAQTKGRPQGSPLLIAKSKSMVSEEIELNHALEKEGVRVIETDLGEYIVQLRHERPSHIITPAAHLRKEQVGELFHEKFGIPYTTDIPTLTATARKVLREIFLTADIGFSGVNFGVAETGTVCIITNEGNGRMVSTIPPVHVALMGMERIVPNLENLSLMLSLLPRSATGQKLTVYTQLLNKPLTNQTRHLIILDNGRTRLRNSPLKESLYCIRCGACLNACPVFRELSGHAYIGKDKSIAPYPGPIGSIISPGLLGENYVHLAQASSLCGACKDVCPVDIDLPKLLTRVRAGQSTQPASGDGKGLSPSTRLGLQLFARLATHPKLFAASQKFAALGSFIVSPRSQWIRLPAITGWGYSKDLPRFAAKTFRESFKYEPCHSEPRASNGEYGEESLRQESETLRSAQGNITGIEHFAKELTALSGHVTLTKNPTEEIISFLNSRGINKIHLEPNTLDENLLREANIEFTNTPDDQILVGVTNAICGLADSGSILTADSALHASLLPEIHIAVLRSSDILPSLPDAMDLVRDKNAAVFITGPSRTADIEMTLTIGVHGPKEIHVFVDVSNSG
jgi:L-lactate dehydrogenase complex protein LldF